MKLPPEIWEQIFLQVQYQSQWSFNSDLLNCSRTCRQFQDILEPYKPAWLFKHVLPHIFSALDKPTLLSLRLVCKYWKWVVNDFLTNYESCWKATQFRHPLPHHREVQTDFHPLGDLQWLTNFSRNWKLKQFLEHPHENYGLPFPGGSVEISFQSSIWNLVPDYVNHQALENADQEQDEFWNLFLELLLKVGVNIIYLKIRIRCHGSENRVLNSLVECLNHVPNLGRLHLDIYFPEKPLLLDKNDDIINALPPLPNLRCLEFAHTYLNLWGYPLPDYFQNRFAARYLPQLKRLQLSLKEGIWNAEYLKVNNKIETFNITDLEFKVTYVGHLRILEFLHLPDSQPKLKKLTLHLMFSYVKSMEVSLKQILKYIVPFADSLEILNLFCADIYLNRRSIVAMIWYGEDFESFSFFYKLKILHLHGFVLERFYDTLIDLFNNMPKSLEYFYIQGYHWNRRHIDLEYRNDEFPDNIWKMCPYLRCLRISDEMRYERDDDGNFVDESSAKIHYREDWECRNKWDKNVKDKLDQISSMKKRNCCALM